MSRKGPGARGPYGVEAHTSPGLLVDFYFLYALIILLLSLLLTARFD